MDALAAYDAGADGHGVTVGVVDTGILESSSEFAGRIHAASADVTGSGRSISDSAGHGTAVASIIAAARDGAGVVGVAFKADILALRADNPGSCSFNCSFNDASIAAGVDRAVANGARVINISLGGAPAGTALVEAIARAAAKKIVIVIAAGNDGRSGVANPDVLAQIASDPRAQGMVIIAGSLDADGKSLSAFSNPAGNWGQYYLTAYGRNVNVLGLDGKTTTASGTSFAAPQIAGAIALLAQYFPNLTGSQIIEILYRTATDLGTSGVDTTFGRGALSLTNAFKPLGTTTLASTGLPVGPDTTATLSPAVDVPARALGQTVVLDSYQRAFGLNLDAMVQRLRPARLSLSGRMGVMLDDVRWDRGATALWLGVAQHRWNDQPGLHQTAPDGARQPSRSWLSGATLSHTVASGLRYSLGASIDPRQLAGTRSAQVPGTPLGQLGLDLSGSGFTAETSGALQFRRNGWSLGGYAGQGHIAVAARAEGQRRGYRILGLSATRQLDTVTLTAGIETLTESTSVLGSSWDGAFGGRGARSTFVLAGVEWQPRPGLSLTGDLRLGYTHGRTTGIVRRADLLSRAASFAATVENVVQPGDRFGLRIGMPLRVVAGGFDLTMPISYDYAAGAAVSGNRHVSLVPARAQVDLEAGYSRPQGRWQLELNGLLRQHPDNRAAPADVGVLLRARRRL